VGTLVGVIVGTIVGLSVTALAAAGNEGVTGTVLADDIVSDPGALDVGGVDDGATAGAVVGLVVGVTPSEIVGEDVLEPLPAVVDVSDGFVTSCTKNEVGLYVAGAVAGMSVYPPGEPFSVFDSGTLRPPSKKLSGSGSAVG
jgi:hypothetical protein